MQLPETGFVRLQSIIGQSEVTDKQAALNRERKKGPRRPRPAIPAVVPIRKSGWWAGVRAGIYPQPVRLGVRVTAWRAEDIRRLIAETSEASNRGKGGAQS